MQPCFWCLCVCGYTDGGLIRARCVAGRTLAWLQDFLQTPRSITASRTAHCLSFTYDSAQLLASALLPLFVPWEEFALTYAERSNLLRKLYWFRVRQNACFCRIMSSPPHKHRSVLFIIITPSKERQKEWCLLSVVNRRLFVLKNRQFLILTHIYWFYSAFRSSYRASEHLFMAPNGYKM